MAPDKELDTSEAGISANQSQLTINVFALNMTVFQLLSELSHCRFCLVTRLK